MSAEPETNIEKQLQAYAQMRRDEAGAFELHPASRRLLQSEVARTYGGAPAPAAAKPGLLAALWLRLALGGGVCAVLALVLMLGPSTRRESAMQMAAQRQATPSADLAATAEREAAETARAPASQRKLDMAAADQAAPAPSPLAITSEPLAAARPAEPSAVATGGSGLARSEDRARMLAKDQQPAVRLKELEAQPAASLPPPPASGLAARRDLAGEIPKAAAPATAPMVKPEAAPSAPPPALAGRAGSGAAEAMRGGPSALAESRAAGRTTGQLATVPALKAPAEEAKGVLADNEAMDLKKTPPAAGKAVTFTTTAELQDAAEAKAKLAFGQRFQQLAAPEKYRRNFNSPPLPQVLNTFQIEQAGSQVRITDEDGSLYLGELTRPEAIEAARSALRPSRMAEGMERQKAAAVKAEPSGETYFLPAGQMLHFRAAGTNSKLNQTVVIEGAFLNYSNAAPAGAPSQAVPAQPAAQGFQQLPLDKLQVQGRAVIGGNSEIPINAVPAKP